MSKTKNTLTTKIDPEKLLPSFGDHPGAAIAEEHPFWLGLTADCPINQLDIAGLHFPKSEEEIVTNPAGRQVRVPVHGALNFHVNKKHFDDLVKVLPRVIIRGAGAGGRKFIIPNEKNIADATTNGRVVKPYVRHPGDRPATDFMYFIHIPEKHRGREYVTISDVGLEWPAALEEIDNFLE